MLSKIVNPKSKKNEVGLSTNTKTILLKRLTHQGQCVGIPSIIPLESKKPLTAKIAMNNREMKKTQEEEIDFQRENYFLEKSYLSSKRTNRPASFHQTKAINTSNLIYQPHQSFSKSPLSNQACSYLEKIIKKEGNSIMLQKSFIANNEQDKDQRLQERKKTLSLLPSINESLFNLSRTSFTRKKTQTIKNQKNLQMLVNSSKNSRAASPAPKFDRNEELENELKSEFSFVRVSRIDEFIELIQEDKVSPNEFIYLLRKKNKDCYDLKVVDYSFIKKMNAVSFYTMSSKGVTLVEKGVPKEFVLLGDWMREREQYSALKKLKFFKNFRKWKSLKKWFQLLRLDWNRKIAKKLNEKLFLVHNVYQRIILKHKEYCFQIENMRLYDLNSCIEPQNLSSFAAMQQRKRRNVFDHIQILSEKMQDSCKIGLNIIMENLRTHILSDLTDDIEQLKLMKKIKPKAEETKNMFDLMGLSSSLNYEYRSLVRMECLKILRLSYLLDFLVMEALASLYYESINDLINKFNLIARSNFDSFPPSPISPKNKIRKEPLFMLDLTIHPTNGHKIEIVHEEVDNFDLSTHINDFDFECFIEYDPETLFPSSSKNEDDEDKSIMIKDKKKIVNNPNNNQNFHSNVIKTTIKKRKPVNLCSLWLKLSPQKTEFLLFLSQTFSEGLEIIQSFPKFVNSPSFLPYFNTLEDWDDPMSQKWVFNDEEEYLDPAKWLKTGKFIDCQKLVDEARKIVENGLNKVSKINYEMDSIVEFIWKDRNTNWRKIFNDRIARPGELLGLVMKYFDYYNEYFRQSIVSYQDLDLFRINFEQIQKFLFPITSKRMEEAVGWTIKLNRQKNSQLKNFFLEGIKALQGLILKIEDFVNQRRQVENLQKNLPLLRFEKDKLIGIQMLIMEQNLELSKEDKDMYIDIVHYESQLNSKLQEIEANLNKNTDRFSKIFQEHIKKLDEKAEELFHQISDEKYLLIRSQDYILSELEIFEKKTKKLQAKYNSLQDQADYLQFKKTISPFLLKLQENLSNKQLLWKSLKEWIKLSDKWRKLQLCQINLPELTNESEAYSQIYLKCGRSMERNEVLEYMKREIEEIKNILPIIDVLKSSYIDSNHLSNDFSAFASILLDPNSSISSILSLPISMIKDPIVNLSHSLEYEQRIFEKINGEEKLWEEKVFKLKITNFDLLILDDVENLMIAIDESINNINGLIMSKFIGKGKEQAEKLREILGKINPLIDKWSECQGKWVYLTKIFNNSELKKEMIGIFQNFDGSDKQLKLLLKKISIQPSVLKLQKPQMVFEQFSKCFDVFCKIEKELEIYLDAKRQLFSRFYFLSNEDLLNMLAEAQNIKNLHTFLPKIFENISKLNVQPDQIVKSVESMEGENLSFYRQGFLIRGSLESWLEILQNNIVIAVKRNIKQGLKDYYAILNRDEWALSVLCQTAMVVTMIAWCSATESQIMNHNMEEWYDSNVKQIENTLEFLKNNKNIIALRKKSFVNLLIIDIHNRDVLQTLLIENVVNLNDFHWQKSLRYYWESDDINGNCFVKQLAQSFSYYCEFLGCSPRLIITPLTERCWLTITTALEIGLGTAPTGPAGTGKTETIKDLAKSLGMFCLVFNCSEQIPPKTMTRILTGAVLQGCWVCLDEFNRMDMEVLSMIASQIQAIKIAILNKDNDFELEGKSLSFKRKTVAVFVTMNPGYAGRIDIPDNLKNLFRPIAMMSPNSQVIVEVTLCSMGFFNAHDLSLKICKFYELCQESFDQQIHYDFGLRALKNMLNLCHDLLEESKNECQSVISAILKSNLSRLSPSDQKIFLENLKIVFNSLSSGISFELLVPATLSSSFSSSLLQIKYLLLLSTIGSRLGTIILGNSGTGKSELLMKIMKDLKIENSLIINPICLTTGELFGHFDNLTQDWEDGGVGSFMRREDEGWIIFDGPVEAEWVENLNSVLDDNNMMCLGNGERIKIKSTTKILFETEDLSKCSPATVSRCGVVYFENELISWKDYFLRWIEKTLSSSLLSEQLICWQYDDFHNDYLVKLMTTIFEVGLRRLNEMKICQRHNDLHLVKNFCKVLECIAKKENGFKMDSIREENKRKIDYIVCYSFIWGMLNFFDHQEHSKIEVVLKDIFRGIIFPKSNSIFDLYLESKDFSSFAVFSLNERTIELNQNNFNEIFIPSSTSERISFIMKRLWKSNQKIFVFGQASTGKTKLIQHVLKEECERFDSHSGYFQFIYRFSPKFLQHFLEKKLQRKGINLLGSPTEKKMIFFLDDIHMAKNETNEFLRHLCTYNNFYQKNKKCFQFVENELFICAGLKANMNAISQRLLSNFIMIQIGEWDTITLKTIFKNFLVFKHHENCFEENVKNHLESLNAFMIDVFTSISKRFFSIGDRFYYSLNLRKMFNALKGLISCNLKNGGRLDEFKSIISHEFYRNFRDPLLKKDHIIFDQIFEEASLRYFKSYKDKPNHLFFTNLRGFQSNQDKTKFESVADFIKLKEILAGYLLESKAKKNNMNLNVILFDEAIKILLSIIRLLNMRSSHILLLGKSSLGRTSLCKLAGFIVGSELYQIENPKTFTLETFNQDLKKLLLESVLKDNKTIILIKNPECLSQSIMIELCSIINKNDLFFWGKDDIDDLLCNSKENLTFDQIKIKIELFLHIVLIGTISNNNFKNLIADFPTLKDQTSVIHFNNWTNDALLSIADFLLADEHDIVPMKECLCRIGVHIHDITYQKIDFLNSQKDSFERNLFPSNFISFFALFKDLKGKTLQRLNSQINRVKVGVSKLLSAQSLISTLKVDLVELQPKLLEQNEILENITKKLNNDNTILNQKEYLISIEKDQINSEALKLESISHEAKMELNQAIPILQQAEESIKKLNKSDIYEIRTFVNPPPIVQSVLEAVCILLEEKTDWQSAKSIMMDIEFLNRLVNYDKNNIKDSIIKKLRPLIRKPEFEPDFVGQKSLACKSLSFWCRAIENYARVIKMVAPKKKKCEEISESLKMKRSELAEKIGELEIVRKQIIQMQSECELNLKIKSETENKIDLTSKRLANAERLIGLLGEERLAWLAQSEKDEKLQKNYIGDTFLSSFTIEYLASFPPDIRRVMTEQIEEILMKENIPYTSPFSIATALSSQLEIQKWATFGLPNDAFSVENAIILNAGKDKWPFIIDSQLSSLEWIRNYSAEKKVRIITGKDHNFLKIMMLGIQFGERIVVEDFDFDDQFNLKNLIEKKFHTKSGSKESLKIQIVQIGERNLEISDHFELIFFTKNPYPNISADAFSKIRLVNFAVTYESLDSQLLSLTISLKNPELEIGFNDVILKMGELNMKLRESQEKILTAFCKENQTYILDDDFLIETLEISKENYEKIKINIFNNEEIEKSLEILRKEWRLISNLGCKTFLAITELKKLDRMLCFSWEFFKSLFCQALIEMQDDKTEQGLKFILQKLFNGISKGLSEKISLLFSFMLSLVYLSHHSSVDFNLLMDVMVFSNEESNSINKSTLNMKPDYIQPNDWITICKLGNFLEKSSKNQFLLSFLENESEWKSLKNKGYFTYFPCIDDLILKREGNDSILLNKSLMMEFFLFFLNNNLIPGDLISNMNRMIKNLIDLKLESFNLKEIIESKKDNYPILFLLSTGIEPTEVLLKLAKEMQKPLHTLSLGQSQNKKALSLIEKSKEAGEWIILQNCHLAKSWMPELETIIDSLNNPKINKGFRIFITTKSFPEFPYTVLLRSLKINLEAEKNIDPNSFKSFSLNSFFNDILFKLSLFHIVLQERNKFSGIGFTRPYDFNDSDYEISNKYFSKYIEKETLEDYELEEINFLVPEIFYGGRIIDNFDKNIIFHLIQRSFIMNYTELESSRMYGFDEREFLIDRKMTSSILGLSQSSEFRRKNEESKIFLQALNEIQLTTIISEEKYHIYKKDLISLLYTIDNELSFMMNKQFEFDGLSIFQQLKHQEIDFFINLIRKILINIKEITEFLEEKQSGNEALFKIISDLINFSTPFSWIEGESKRKIGNWINYLKRKFEFYINWKNDNDIMYLPALYFPKRYFNILSLYFSTKFNIPTEKIQLKFKVTDFFEIPKENMQKSFYINGLFLEGAKWDKKKASLEKEDPNTSNFEMPIIKIQIDDSEENQDDFYECPLYKSFCRKSGFVLNINLRTKFEKKEYWIIRGVALLCELENQI